MFHFGPRLDLEVGLRGRGCEDTLSPGVSTNVYRGQKEEVLSLYNIHSKSGPFPRRDPGPG